MGNSFSQSFLTEQGLKIEVSFDQNEPSSGLISFSGNENEAFVSKDCSFTFALKFRNPSAVQRFQETFIWAIKKEFKVETKESWELEEIVAFDENENGFFVNEEEGNIKIVLVNSHESKEKKEFVLGSEERDWGKLIEEVKKILEQKARNTEEENQREEKEKMLFEKENKKKKKNGFEEIRDVTNLETDLSWEPRIKSEAMNRVQERIMKRKKEGEKEDNKAKWASNSKGRHIAERIRATFSRLKSKVEDLNQIIDSQIASLAALGGPSLQCKNQYQKPISDFNNIEGQNSPKASRDPEFSYEEMGDLVESLVIETPISDLLPNKFKETIGTKANKPESFVTRKGPFKKSVTSLMPPLLENSMEESFNEGSFVGDETIIQPNEYEDMGDSLALSESQMSRAPEMRHDFQGVAKKLSESHSGEGSDLWNSIHTSSENSSNKKTQEDGSKVHFPGLISSEIMEVDSAYEESPIKTGLERNFSSISGMKLSKKLTILIDEEEKNEEIESDEYLDLIIQEELGKIYNEIAE